MKLLLLPLLSGICILPVSNPFEHLEKHPLSTNVSVTNEVIKGTSQVALQDSPEFGKMRSVIFKNQEYCRADLKDFDFDARFSVVSATVYFSGANFRSIEKGYITSNSLKPIKALMDKCIPGSLVVFDDVKVKGPDNLIRTIPGISLQLY